MLDTTVLSNILRKVVVRRIHGVRDFSIVQFLHLAIFERDTERKNGERVKRQLLHVHRVHSFLLQDLYASGQP